MGTRFLRTAMVVVSLCVPAVAAAQAEAGSTRVGGLVGGWLTADHAASTVGFSVSRRLSRGLALEGDLSYFSDLTLFEYTHNASLGSWHARTTSATANLTYTLPGGRRLRPYVLAGGGAARVGREVHDPQLCPCSSTHYVKPVVAAGGGIDVLVWRDMAVGLDARYQRVFEDQGIYRPNLRDVKRVATSISYRF
jgi:opacity protein-like surface antigen